LQVIEALAEEGVTLIIVTHEMNFARKVCDRIIFMHMGLVHEVGTPEEIFNAPRTPELRSFISMK
jgi:polar amino acid transport system ATP-binding protein